MAELPVAVREALARLTTVVDFFVVNAVAPGNGRADLALVAEHCAAERARAIEECVECVAKQFRIDALQESIDGCTQRVAALAALIAPPTAGA